MTVVRPISCRVWLVLAVGMALTGGQMSLLHAAKAKAKRITKTLPPMVVTATYQQSPLVTFIDPKAPRQPIPASDGADLLKTVPGFSLMRKGGANGDPVFRGMAVSRLNIVLNGTRLAGGCPGRMDPPTAYVSPVLYDEITLIKGPESVLYGPVGPAGTVLFQRHTPRYERPSITTDASVIAGSYGRNDQTVEFRSGTPGLYMNVGGNRTHSSDYRDGHGNRVQSGYSRWATHMAIGWTPDKDTVFELTAGAGNGKAAYAFSTMDGVQFLRRSTALRIEKKHMTRHLRKLMAKIYRNDVDHVMDNYTLRHPDPASSMPKAMVYELQRNTSGGRIAATFNWNALELTTGLDASSSIHNARFGGPKQYKTRPRVRDAKRVDHGFFAQATWQKAERDRLIGGMRLDRFSVRGYGRAIGVPTGVSGDRRATLPGGFFRYEHDLLSSGTLYVGLGHAERFPDYGELFGGNDDTTFARFSQLKPERTTQLDVGMQYHHARLKNWISGYAGVIDRYILIHYGAKSGYASNINARIAGGEMGAQYKFTEHWKSSATLSYAWGQDRSEHRPLPQMPPLETKLGLDWSNGTWSAGVLWRLVAKQTRVAVGEGNIISQDLGQSAGFGVFSVHAGWRIASHCNLTTGVDNLLNKAYAEHISPSVVELPGFTTSTRVNEPGRMLWMKLDFFL